MNNQALQNLTVASFPLFQLDLNYQNLSEELHSMKNCINQHASLLNVVSDEIPKKTDQIISMIQQSYSKMQESALVYDNDFMKILTQQMQKPKPEKSGIAFEDSTNKVCNKLTILGNAITYLFQKSKERDKRISAMEKEMKDKISSDKFKKKTKKNKKEMEDKFDDLKLGIEKQVHDVDKKLSKEISNFSDRVHEVERKTVWRIQDCEELYKKRITQDYVDTSLQQMEEKLLKEIQENTGGGKEQMENIQLELNFKLKHLDDVFTDKLKNQKKFLRDFEDIFNYQTIKKDVFDNNQSQMSDKINELTQRIRSQENINLSQHLDHQNKQILRFDQQMKDIEKTLNQKIKDLSNKLQKNLNPNTDQNAQNISKGGIDPHKLCAIEADLHIAENNINEHTSIIQKLQEEMKEKLEKFNSEWFDQLITGRQQSPSKKAGLDKDQIKLMIDEYFRMGQGLDEDRSKRIARDLQELFRRTDTFQDTEQRLQRILKELDINNLVKTIRQKADQDDVRKDLLLIETKNTGLNEQLQYIRKDIDNLFALYKKLLSASYTNITHNEQNINTILTTKKIHPIQCLSCGVNSQYHPIHTLKGQDNKFYKTDAQSIRQYMQYLNNGNEEFVPYFEQDETAKLNKSAQSLKPGRDMKPSCITQGKNRKVEVKPDSKKNSCDNQQQIHNGSISKILRPGSAKK